MFFQQIAGFNGLSDALKRLDFRSAVHDGRRFHYICKLLDLLITQKLSMLSGCAQKVLFAMLEEVAYQGIFYEKYIVISSQNFSLTFDDFLFYFQCQPASKMCIC